MDETRLEQVCAQLEQGDSGDKGDKGDNDHKDGKSALDLLQEFDDFSQVNQHGKSLFDCAIIGEHESAIRFLAAQPGAREFASPLPPEQKKTLKYMVSSGLPSQSIDAMEDYVRQALGPDCSFERTPLLLACRLKRHQPVSELLANKANTGQVDSLGICDLEYAYQGQDKKFLSFVLDECESHQIRVKTTQNFIESIILEQDLLNRVLEQATLNIASKRYLFNYYCAKLDKANIRRMLDDGLDVNKMFSRDLNPVYEIATSHQLWAIEHPDYLDFAFLLAQSKGAANTHSIQIDNSAFATGDVGKLMAQAQSEICERKARLKNHQMSAADIEAQTRQRINLIELLFEHGLDAKNAGKKLPDMFASDLFNLGQLALLKSLAAAGLKIRLADYEDFNLSERGKQTLSRFKSKSEVLPETPRWQALYSATDFWELPGETTLMAKITAGESGKKLIKVSVHNVYGKIPGVAVSLISKQGAAAVAMPVVEEIIEYDGETCLVENAPEEIFEEAPWCKTFALTLAESELGNLRSILLETEFAAIEEVALEWSVKS